MTRSRDSLVPFVGLFAGLGAQLGCGPEDTDACAKATYDPPPAPGPNPTTPTVSSGRWLSSTTLELQFTAPITSDGDPDPARFAVLGFSVIAYEQYESVCYVRTRYSFVGPTGGYYNPSISMGVDTVWIPPEDNTLLRLRISMPDTCPPPLSTGRVLGSGVLLTYAGGSELGGDRLLDGQGNPLADIGIDWAIVQVEDCIEDVAYGYYIYCATNDARSGQLPGLTSLVEIPCPEDRS